MAKPNEPYRTVVVESYRESGSGLHRARATRLLALNAERHAEEVRLGIAPGMKGKKDEIDEDGSDEE
jgi:hypothetical protein